MMWFTFKGEDSRDYGLRLTDTPIIARAERRIAREENVPGRDGALVIYDGAYNDVDTELHGYIDSAARINDAFEWLTGAGELVLSTDQTRAYRARDVRQIEVERVVRNMDARLIHIPMRLEPFRYHHPSVDLAAITVSGTTRTNPGTHAARPRIKIEGNGDIIVTVAGQPMEFEGVSGGVIVDSEMMDVFNLSETKLLNHIATMDDYPVLPAGSFAVTWSGSVSRVTITPRSRDL